MHLTRFTDLAVRVLIYLALAPERLVTIGEIGTRYGVSHNHLSKVVTDLIRSGYVRSVRGRHGGLCLAARPEEIRLGRLVRHMEALELVECQECDREVLCLIRDACRFRELLGRATEAFMAELDRHTLADLVQRPHHPALRELVSVPSR